MNTVYQEFDSFEQQYTDFGNGLNFKIIRHVDYVFGVILNICLCLLDFNL